MFANRNRLCYIDCERDASIMFLAQENIPFMILAVRELCQAFSPSYNTKIRFNALSFKYESDAVIENENKV